MPTNSDYDGYFSGMNGIPLFTYGMITTTIVVLSYMTFMEPDTPEDVIEATTESSMMTPFGIPTVPDASEPQEIQPENPEEMVQPENPEEMIQPENPEENISKEGGGRKGTKKRRTKRRRPKINA